MLGVDMLGVECYRPQGRVPYSLIGVRQARRIKGEED